VFGEYPQFTPETRDWCERNGDYRPMLFEWYKTVGETCNMVASCRGDSPAFRPLPEVHYAVLIGLLNRCSRLMLSNTALSSTTKFGETVQLIDRCIGESAIKVRWLCLKGNPDSFTRFLADGLKADVAMKREVLENVAARGGTPLLIEQRMIASIEECCAAAELEDEAIADARRLPDMRSMLRDLGVEREMYTAIQRMGSHSVHGTWTDLYLHYLRIEDGEFRLRDHDVATHHNQFVFTILMVLWALRDFMLFMCVDAADSAPMLEHLDECQNQVIAIDRLDHGDDFSPAAPAI